MATHLITQPPTDLELSHRIAQLGAPFAKALAVFLQELGSQNPSQHTSNPAVSGMPQALHSALDQFAQDAARESRAERAGGKAAAILSPDSLDDFASRLRAVLKSKGLTQQQLAQRVGMNPTTLSRVLKSPGKSRIATFQKIALALDLGLRDLL